MSRVVTPHTPQTTPGTTPMQGTGQVRVPHEKIAMRAYEKWMKKGCPLGTEMQDWLEAEAELRIEAVRGVPGNSGTYQPRR